MGRFCSHSVRLRRHKPLQRVTGRQKESRCDVHLSEWTAHIPICPCRPMIRAARCLPLKIALCPPPPPPPHTHTPPPPPPPLPPLLICQPIAIQVWCTRMQDKEANKKAPRDAPKAEKQKDQVVGDQLNDTSSNEMSKTATRRRNRSRRRAASKETGQSPPAQASQKQVSARTLHLSRMGGLLGHGLSFSQPALLTLDTASQHQLIAGRFSAGFGWRIRHRWYVIKSDRKIRLHQQPICLLSHCAACR